MVFSSIVFLVWFFPISLILYYLLPKALKNYFLLVVSLVFYAWGAPKFSIILVSSVVLDFYLIKKMELSESKKQKKLFLGISIGISLIFLAYFKYANFFIENVNTVLTTFLNKQINWVDIVLPIGISFFTFQKITYGIDIYRGRSKSAKNAANYLLYVVMFPQLIAGPIVRYNTIAEQINNRSEPMMDRINGFIRFGIGLAKKVLLANTMGEYADSIFNNSFESIGMFTAWLAILAYAFQIYYDFSGYSDMAIGIGRMLGFTFPENFDSPYTSKSITEFWRRWHITLGHWMRDYLYIPLGGNRVSTKARVYMNLWIVFLISGLWHGASWNFIIWGAYHGLFLALDKMFLLKFLSGVGRFWAWLLNFIIVLIGWVFFRIEEFDQAILFLKRMFSFDFEQHHDQNFGFWLLLLLSFLFSVFSATIWGKQLEIAFFRGSKTKSITIVNLTIVILLYLLCLSMIIGTNYNPFIYFRF